jgi:hypothetical protein
MGMNEVGRYREYAANCLNIAQNTADPNAKLTLLDMAQVWIVLAQEAERNGELRPDPVTRKSSAKSSNSPPT